MGIKGLTKNPIGLAIVGCGRVGQIRGRCAAEYPGVEWIGCCDIDEGRAKAVAEELGADFYCTDYKELLGRSEVNAAVLATDENEHAGTLWAAIEHGHSILVEKPLATNVVESAGIVEAADKAGVDLLVGYTQRFRRRWLTAREQVAQGMLGDITSATTRAFLNGLTGPTRLEANEDRSRLTPMVVSGTHALDVIFWVLGEGKKPAEVYARSVDKSFAGLGTQDSTFSIFTFDDGTLWSMSCCWALPKVWPASTYSLEIGIVGTEGVLTIDDTHRDMVMASEKPWQSHRGSSDQKNVTFLCSYPPGDMSNGQFWGPMREESNAWLARLYTGVDTPHATGAEGHRNLMMTMACDLSAKRKKPLSLPISPEEIEAEL
ncbi:MAG: Gfo/Idh/MocA family oxidoreductase [Nitrospinaceae bacterium]|jgi:myo-inositol 2-dehydrogenase / D-chiro-inositol 1-dehydrogenase|nr:Gfo/Idh/MocA family oxidoreductase [Nitrospinaceae bacterium]MBT5369207.1 Gfo/Idh/MocA family oxidoreductase [Nitrospinaceae bacterium]MBT5947933.1 Gfo/Idh/MocA family oxidoreductase [Nitrospinaceae bacterium]MBT6393501.1 Gfo/Idh/MocA family oxidoreductase [Nitrospinaceae bacterium]MBT7855421.1 Gfo/Idh/MocA family oxidoreductase [Nitrospinaceae bacterium]